jgi:uncharacterized protein (TIGR02284 family)
MENLKKILEVLNDLIRINKDREVGYAKISRDLTPAEHNLRSAFERKAQDSRNNIMQLEHKADEIRRQLGGDPETKEIADNNGLSGRIYKMWAEVKDFFSGNDRSAVIKSCVDGEEKAQKCYENALTEYELPEDISALLTHQKSSLDASQQEMRNYLERGELKPDSDTTY